MVNRTHMRMPVQEKACDCCGQTLPRPLAIDAKLSEAQWQLLEYVHAAGSNGIHQDRLFNLIYGHDPDGGPLSGLKTVHVRVSQLNRLLRGTGYYVQGRFGSAQGRYVLTRTPSPGQVAYVVQQALA